MYLINLDYIKPLDAVEEHLDAHIAFLEKYYQTGNFICSGRKNPRVGGIILCEFSSEAELRLALVEDPFFNNKIANYDIIEFSPTKFAAGFEQFM